MINEEQIRECLKQALMLIGEAYRLLPHDPPAPKLTLVYDHARDHACDSELKKIRKFRRRYYNSIRIVQSKTACCNFRTDPSFQERTTAIF